MWGGWIGRMMGTHHFTREERRYQGGNCLIDWFSFRATADLHSNQDWRQRVHRFVFSDPAPRQMQMTTEVDHHRQQPARRPNLISHGGTNVAISRRDPWGPFTVDRDRCQPSTFEDYCTGKCWLCQEDSRERYHMWVQCGHIFCSDCSDAMMQRSMPCPLCRKVSTMIVEAPRQWTPYVAPEIISTSSRTPSPGNSDGASLGNSDGVSLDIEQAPMRCCGLPRFPRFPRLPQRMTLGGKD